MLSGLQERSRQALADAPGRVLWSTVTVCAFGDLLAYLLFGPLGLCTAVILQPTLVYAWVQIQSREIEERLVHKDTLSSRMRVEARLDQLLHDGHDRGTSTAAFVMRLDHFATLCERLGQRNCEIILRRTQDRLIAVMRDRDLVARFDGAGFAMALSPVSMIDLETAMQIAARLHRAVSEPLILDGVPIKVTASIGVCLDQQLEVPSGLELMDAAEAALVEAARNGPAATRVYTAEMHNRRETERALIEELHEAMGSAQIRPWFQPQVSTDTGQISGFEALIRWEHPERGIVSPADFLPAVEQAGLSERLGEIVLHHALTALKAWDRAGLQVPNVGINLTRTELENPMLADQIAWQLDRFELGAERITIEVLETVIADSPESAICKNIEKLSRLGCGIDLDDFGTGHASITSLRQFPIKRLKIDRAFVTNLDRDPEQQRMISTILTMAENLGLETLAEGVETGGEHAMAAQLGCAHVQGYGIARPMPFEDTPNWLVRHAEKLPRPPDLHHSKS